MVVSNILHVHPYFGKLFNLTNYFSDGLKLQGFTQDFVTYHLPMGGRDVDISVPPMRCAQRFAQKMAWLPWVSTADKIKKVSWLLGEQYYPVI